MVASTKQTSVSSPERVRERGAPTVSVVAVMAPVVVFPQRVPPDRLASQTQVELGGCGTQAAVPTGAAATACCPQLLLVAEVQHCRLVRGGPNGPQHAGAQPPPSCLHGAC